MSPVTLSTLLALAASFSFVAAQDGVTGTFPATPLASKHFAYPTGIPYQVDTDTQLIRGVQTGYNICNSTTENQDSLCQTSIVNSIDDFCLWAPSKPDSLVANTEGEMVAWCTKPGHGTRLIPRGALQGVQFIKTPAYLAIVGFIDQSKIDIQTGDFGGELDPHGADLRGNPMGGIMYSTGFGTDNTTYTQVIEWHNFMGGGAFCLKACDPANPDAAHFCEHVYDRIGCKYNVPNNAQNGTFEVCQGDNQDFPGIYTSNGQVITYSQPPESLGAIQTMPYEPIVPSSSNCQTFTSSVLYSALATVIAPGDATSTASSSSATQTGSQASGASASGSGTRSGPAGPQNTSNDATTLAISGVSILGVVFSALFLS